MTLTLTPHQQKAFRQLQAFVTSEREQIFVLRGYAGTGKTTLAKFLLDWIEEASVSCVPVLLASTGRAARILGEKTGRGADTIHGHIYTLEKIQTKGQREKPEAEASGQLVMNFGLKRPFPIEQPYLFLIDEASMLSHQKSAGNSVARFGSGSVLDDFFSYLRSEDKVVFIGDPAQLPPVLASDSFSPALDENFLSTHYGRAASAITLTEVLRQAEENPILALATEIRKRLETKDFYGWEELLQNARSHNIFTPYTQNIMLDRYLAKAKGKWAEGIILTHSNKQAYYLNINIRKKLAGGKYLPHPVKGEILLVSQNSYYVPLSNGDRVELLRSEKGGIRKGLKFSRVHVRALHNGEKYETLLLQDFLFRPEANLPAEIQQRLLIDFDQRMREKGLKRDSEPYLNAMRTDPYLNALRAKFGYAVTCHKAQGGEWPHCFLNLSDTLNMLTPEARFRWLYTAVSRARDFLDIKPVFKQPKKQSHAFKSF